MLARHSRIPSSFFALRSKGDVYRSDHLLLSVLKNKDNIAHFSFSISKKVSKTAVGRNLFRRRGYSIINEIKSDIRPACIYFFSARASIRSYEGFRGELISLLRKSGSLIE